MMAMIITGQMNGPLVCDLIKDWLIDLLDYSKAGVNEE